MGDFGCPPRIVELQTPTFQNAENIQIRISMI